MIGWGCVANDMAAEPGLIYGAHFSSASCLAKTARVLVRRCWRIVGMRRISRIGDHAFFIRGGDEIDGPAGRWIDCRICKAHTFGRVWCIHALCADCSTQQVRETRSDFALPRRAQDLFPVTCSELGGDIQALLCGVLGASCGQCIFILLSVLHVGVYRGLGTSLTGIGYQVKLRSCWVFNFLL